MNSIVRGNAVAVFGGKVGGLVYKSEIDEPHIVISLRELDEKVDIGDLVEDKDNINEDSHIYLVFNNLKSIDIVKEWLDEARNELELQLKNSQNEYFIRM